MIKHFLEEWNNADACIEVQTSGSTGVPKRMLVEKTRMLASARMTCDFLGLHKGDTALLCMPLEYIAGKMMVVRSIERGLKLTVVKPSLHPFDECTEPFDFIAMVPSQVYESIDNPLLRASRHIIIGGGAISEELEERLRDFPNNVWSTYGMTETLSHIALRRINGEEASCWYTPFEGVKVSLNADGCLVIDAPYVCGKPLETNDIAEMDDNRFRIIGRKDNVICSGGVKIQAEEVEAKLRRHLTAPFYITKQSDVRFGEVVVLVTEASQQQFADIQTVCQRELPRYWCPKRIVHVDSLPMTETGKVKRIMMP